MSWCLHVFVHRRRRLSLAPSSYRINTSDLRPARVPYTCSAKTDRENVPRRVRGFVSKKLLERTTWDIVQRCRHLAAMYCSGRSSTGTVVCRAGRTTDQALNVHNIRPIILTASSLAHVLYRVHQSGSSALLPCSSRDNSERRGAVRALSRCTRTTQTSRFFS
ncbi:hypothetical protein K466DRAFT_19355 [Polyporus arcularius HHB13444]|uniref:Uncharacterized protein n=1 Tax=Polyporus arcularius HHB13444 TaxID=1314778 RepID=A0A5C3PKG2_9APHY|nr:hypothetical protein K466DRAFT_19355 [Polyporus arcularius HHB13444]